MKNKNKLKITLSKFGRVIFLSYLCITKQINMQRKKLYLTVEITIESDKEITEDTLQSVATELDYDFSYDQDGVKIVPHFTEIIDVSETLNQ